MKQPDLITELCGRYGVQIDGGAIVRPTKPKPTDLLGRLKQALADHPLMPLTRIAGLLGVKRWRVYDLAAKHRLRQRKPIWRYLEASENRLAERYRQYRSIRKVAAEIGVQSGYLAAYIVQTRFWKRHGITPKIGGPYGHSSNNDVSKDEPIRQ